MIKQRLKYAELSPAPYQSMLATLTALGKGELDNAIIELVYMRVSQINGCAYCLDMHGKALRKSGYSQAKLDTLAGWQVSHEFNEAERAVLEWTDSVTLIAATGAPDSAFNALQAHFSDSEISELTFAISIMNAFNRLAISMRQ
ncbi:Argininosuccinate synthase [Leminorella richardii]|uniref:Argininosuccinate synthase n=1 Tax=Leminorella richardii TaxID=158841 RepID=A0A2X4UU25_9GAMM|nr:carboxymuconolactone decarboxylase family protein [Leminorella richardii]SQI39148.1 Argininosuccinate synthase [Leminorella richardii]